MRAASGVGGIGCASNICAGPPRTLKTERAASQGRSVSLLGRRSAIGRFRSVVQSQSYIGPDSRAQKSGGVLIVLVEQVVDPAKERGVGVELVVRGHVHH